jgi:hypothetical protein
MILLSNDEDAVLAGLKEQGASQRELDAVEARFAEGGRVWMFDPVQHRWRVYEEQEKPAGVMRTSMVSWKRKSGSDASGGVSMVEGFRGGRVRFRAGTPMAAPNPSSARMRYAAPSPRPIPAGVEHISPMTSLLLRARSSNPAAVAKL